MLLIFAIPAIGALLIAAGVECYVRLLHFEPFDFLSGLTIATDDEDTQ